MKWVKAHIIGILGTVIVHLVLAIIFMIFKITTFKPYLDTAVVINFEPEPVPEPDRKEQNAQVDAELEKLIHNIAVNRALKTEEDFDINKYVDQVKNEMIKAGELGKDNFIDQWRHRQEAGDEEISATLEEKPLETESTEKPSDIMASRYSGPTRVEYFLKNRYAIKMKVPVYKCEGSGTVVVNIQVDRLGNVISADADKTKSSRNECMLNAAIEAARTSLFNKDPSAPLAVPGTITYYFVAQ